MSAEQRTAPIAEPGTLWLLWRLIWGAPLQFVAMAIERVALPCWPILAGLSARGYLDRTTGHSLSQLLACLLALGVALALRSGAGGSATRWAREASALLQRNLIGRSLERPSRQLLAADAAAIEQLREDLVFIGSLGDRACDLVGALLALGIALVVLRPIDAPLMSLLVLVAIGAAVAPTESLGSRAWPRAENDDRADSIAEIVGARRSIRAAVAEAQFIARVGELSRRRDSADLSERRRALVKTALCVAIPATMLGLALVVADTAMPGAGRSAGDAALLAGCGVAMVASGRRIGASASAYRLARAALGRIAHFLDGSPLDRLVATAPAFPAAAPQSPPTVGQFDRLDIRDLICRAPEGGAIDAIDAIDFSLRRGTLTVIIGPSGSGKTTLLRALLGLIELDRGVISWSATGGVETCGALTSAMAGYLPQTPRLLRGTLRENLTLGRPIDDAALVQALDQAGLGGTSAAWLNSAVGDERWPSAEQTVRLTIARCLIYRPPLIIFDDPAQISGDMLARAPDGAIDGHAMDQIIQRLQGGGATLLVVSQHAATIERADQRLVLHDKTKK